MQPRRSFPQMVGLVSTLLILMMALAWGGRAALAADAPPIPLTLGQYTSVELAPGEQVTYQVAAPESGQYVLTATEGDAAAFTVTVSDADGNVVLDDTFGDLSIDLEAGVYDLTLATADGGSLTFTMVGFVGFMNADAREPGRLYAGSAYQEDDVVDTRYATVTIPESTYPRPVFLYVSPKDPEQGVLTSVEGDDDVSTSLSSEDGEVLGFWSDGGAFQVTVEPIYDSTSFTLIVFLAAEPAPLAVGDSLDDVAPVSNTRLVYPLRVEDFYDSLTVDLAWGDATIDLDLTVADQLSGAAVFASSAATDSKTESVELTDVFPGVYLIIIDRFTTISEAVDLSISIEGVPGRPLEMLEDGLPATGSGQEGETIYYAFDVAEAGDLISVDLVADDESADFDLSVGMRADQVMFSSATYRASEFLTFLAPVAGRYYVSVSSYSGGGDYTLTATEGDQAEMLEVNDLAHSTVPADRSAFFRLPVDQPGQLLTVILVGDGQSDLDLSIESFDERGQLVHSQSSTTAGPYEIVSLAQATPGMYTVRVDSYGDASDFSLITRLENPRHLVRATLDVVNNSSVDICTVHIVPVKGINQPSNRLTDGQVLLAGDTYTVELRAGRYDLTAFDCKDRTVSELPDIFLQGQMTWTVQ